MAMLHFQNHYSSVQYHMILQKNHSNMLITYSNITISLIALDLIWLSQHPPGWMTLLIGLTLVPNAVGSIQVAQTLEHFVRPMRVRVYV